MGAISNNPPPIDEKVAVPAGSVPNTVGNLKDAFGNLSQVVLQAMTAPGAKLGESTLQSSQRQDVLESARRDVHQTPSAADATAVMSVMMEPEELLAITNKLNMLPNALTSLQGAVNQQAISNLQAPDEERIKAASQHAQSFNQRIDAAGSSSSGSSGQVSMFSAAAIELAAVFAEIAQMKKGQAAAFAEASQNAIRAMIDGSHVQAELEHEKGQTEAQAAFMSAALQGIGAGISFLGAARCLQASKTQMIDDPTRPPGFDPSRPGEGGKMIDQTVGGRMQAITQMWGAVGNMFGQVGTNIVEGVKAGALGNIEAQKVILSNAMQILGQMMSKWGDEEKSAHEAIHQLADAMQQMMQKLIFSSDKLSV